MVQYSLGSKFCYLIFWFSHSKVSDANIGIIANVVYLWKSQEVPLFLKFTLFIGGWIHTLIEKDTNNLILSHIAWSIKCTILPTDSLNTCQDTITPWRFSLDAFNADQFDTSLLLSILRHASFNILIQKGTVSSELTVIPAYIQIDHSYDFTK